MSLFDTIDIQLAKGDEISPFLFMGNNLELLQGEIHTLAGALAEKYSVNKAYIKTLADTGESIKIAEVKSFFESAQLQTDGKFQIFILENISRMSLSSANSCLKIFEEPGKGNIIFLTNVSESGVLDTILSRVQTFRCQQEQIGTQNTFYESLIEKFVGGKDSQIFSYFYQNASKKEELVSFLQTLLSYSMKNGLHGIVPEDLFDDIRAIEKNNVGAKGIVDKYLLLLEV